MDDVVTALLSRYDAQLAGWEAKIEGIMRRSPRDRVDPQLATDVGSGKFLQEAVSDTAVAVRRTLNVPVVLLNRAPWNTSALGPGLSLDELQALLLDDIRQIRVNLTCTSN